MSAPTPLEDSYELAVVGAGPAGLAAANARRRARGRHRAARRAGAPGGQIYRAIGATPVRDRATLGTDYWHGASLLEPFRRSGAAYCPGATVWSVSRDGEIGLSVAGGARLVRAGHVILATGALERPFPRSPAGPCPGSLPPERRRSCSNRPAWLPRERSYWPAPGRCSGSSRRNISGGGDHRRSPRHDAARQLDGGRCRICPAFLVSSYWRKGLALLREVRQRVPVITGVTALAAIGEEHVREIAYRQGAGAEQRLAVETLLLHQGVVPNLNLAVSIGCRTPGRTSSCCFPARGRRVGHDQRRRHCRRRRRRRYRRGARRRPRGRLAALDAARRLGRIDPARRDAWRRPHRAALAQSQRGRRLLDRLYRPLTGSACRAGATIVCRCEEVTAQRSSTP